MLKRTLAAFSMVLLSAGAAQATPMLYVAPLMGSIEVPPNNSPGTGFAAVTYDPTTRLLGISTTFQGLTSPDNAAHIHCCVAPFGTAGVWTPVPAFPGFPLGVTSGSYSGVLDLSLASSWNPAFLMSPAVMGNTAVAEMMLANGLAAGQSYFNIHTDNFPGGEIRGFLSPEPATVSLLALGGIGAIAAARRKRRNNTTE